MTSKTFAAQGRVSASLAIVLGRCLSSNALTEYVIIAMHWARSILTRSLYVVMLHRAC